MFGMSFPATPWYKWSSVGNMKNPLQTWRFLWIGNIFPYGFRFCSKPWDDLPDFWCGPLAEFLALYFLSVAQFKDAVAEEKKMAGSLLYGGSTCGRPGCCP